MATKIGSQDGIKAAMNRLRDLDPAGTLLKKGADGKWPDISTLTQPLDQWKAYDKWQRTQQILRDDHDASFSNGGTTPPPIVIDGLAKLAQKVIFCAHEPLAAMGAPTGHIVALTADPGYSSFVDQNVINQLRSRFAQLASWGVQTQIPAQTIRDFQARWGLDYCIFQGETDEEYRTAIECGAEVIVGNANSWTEAHRADAIERVNAGTLAFTQETYTNLGGPWPEDSSSAGVPCASFTLGVYDGSHEQADGWNPSLQAYKDHTPPSVWPNVCIYHASGVNPAEWSLLVAT